MNAIARDQMPERREVTERIERMKREQAERDRQVQPDELPGNQPSLPEEPRNTAKAGMTESDILTALRQCYDPELPCNIVDLGLIQSITVTPDPEAPGAGIPGVPQKHKVYITLIPTNPTEAAEAHLRAQIANRLAGLETISQTTVEILPAPAWTPASITPAGRRILGLDGNPNLIQIR